MWKNDILTHFWHDFWIRRYRKSGNLDQRAPISAKHIWRNEIFLTRGKKRWNRTRKYFKIKIYCFLTLKNFQTPSSRINVSILILCFILFLFIKICYSLSFLVYVLFQIQICILIDRNLHVATRKAVNTKIGKNVARTS